MVSAILESPRCATGAEAAATDVAAAERARKNM
jgi:hypothetical protein